MLEYAPRAALIFILVSVVISGLALLGAKVTPDTRGWRSLKPSAMHWVGFGLSAGLSLFMAYIYLFVGSSRPDGPQQMRILFWLIVAFALGSLIASVCMFMIRRSAVRWRGWTLAFTGQHGPESRQLTDITSLRMTPLGRVLVQFKDGATLAIDPYASGAAELIERINRMLDPSVEEGATR